MMNLYYLQNRLKLALLQLKENWQDALLSGIAAGIAWFISQTLLGHPHPFFAAVTALICLAPGLPNHGRQAIYVLIGVITGVLVGEATLLLPPMPTEIRIALVSCIGMLIASAYANIPVIIVQAGVSAVMVFSMGAEVAGFTRLADVLVGTVVGLVFSQLLFTPDPLKILKSSIELLFREVANNYTLAANALEHRNMAGALRALKSCARTHAALIALIGNIDVVRDNTRWTLRGRMASREATSLAVRYDQAGIRIYASTLLFCEALSDNMRKKREEVPDWLLPAIRLAAKNSIYLAGRAKRGEGAFIKPDRSIREDTPHAWRDCAKSLELAENTLAHFYKSKTRKLRLLTHRLRNSDDKE